MLRVLWNRMQLSQLLQKDMDGIAMLQRHDGENTLFKSQSEIITCTQFKSFSLITIKAPWRNYEFLFAPQVTQFFQFTGHETPQCFDGWVLRTMLRLWGFAIYPSHSKHVTQDFPYTNTKCWLVNALLHTLHIFILQK